MTAGSRLNSDPESGVHRLNFLGWEIGLSLSLKMCRPVPNADLLNVAKLPERVVSRRRLGRRMCFLSGRKSSDERLSIRPVLYLGVSKRHKLRETWRTVLRAGILQCMRDDLLNTPP